MLRKFIIWFVVISFNVLASNYDVYIGDVKDINGDDCCYNRHPSIGFISSWGDINEYERYSLNDFNYIYKGRLDREYHPVLDESYYYLNDCPRFYFDTKADFSSFFLEKYKDFVPFECISTHLTYGESGIKYAEMILGNVFDFGVGYHF
ncbi:hypothetical protein GKR59_01900 [Providencia alcalifaciens]|uniref:hypothetical protein n=1 Tax=Providencia TaxID=586 RepID=UPI0012B5AB54|nr:MULTISPECIES: hypothetical protein [Providencia]MTC48408.1 hypothetical protein [Providencia alcalifaciens]